MKKTTITIIILLILSTSFLAGCAESAEMMDYGTLDELKEAIGDTLLYPDVTPDGFEIDLATFQSSYYKPYNTCEYYINFHSIYARDISNENFWRLNEGESTVTVAWITIWAYEPKHKEVLGGRLISRTSETNRYEKLIAEGEVWEIEGVTVAREIKFYRSEKGYTYNGPDEEEKEKRENISPEHYDYSAHALFKHGEILYSVDFKAYGRDRETESEMLDMCDNMVKLIIAGMIGGEGK